MNLVKDFSLLKEFGYNPRIWVEYEHNQSIEYTDGYFLNVEPSDLEGNPIFIHTGHWLSEEKLPLLERSELETIIELNKHFRKDKEESCADANFVLNEINKGIGGLTDIQASTTGILYKRNNACNVPASAMQDVFSPDGCKVIHYPDEQYYAVNLTDSVKDLSVTYTSDEDNYKLVGYKYIPEVAEVVEQATLIYTAKSLAGVTGEKSKFGFFHCKLVEDGYFNYKDVSNELGVNVKTKMGQLIVDYHIPLNTQDSVASVSDGLDSIANSENWGYFSKLHGFIRFRIDGMFCSKITYKNGLLNIMIKSAVVYGKGEIKILDLPIHLVCSNTNTNYCLGGKTVGVRVSYRCSTLSIPFSLLSCLDTSATLEDFFDADMLCHIDTLDSYIRAVEEELEFR